MRKQTEKTEIREKLAEISNESPGTKRNGTAGVRSCLKKDVHIARHTFKGDYTPTASNDRSTYRWKQLTGSHELITVQLEGTSE
ncbi:hypothetical protein HHI36_024323 [Cryptolaemus montrouzieri]|uniref:Uncharacterized protein n=1 Tax=Cryptolaemus montrouzieri TaxID=559131 RepID=A0ABD2N8E4_9CUCU